MGKELTIVAAVGAFIFGMWYFNKGGCETDLKALCWNGPSLEEIVNGAMPGGDETPLVSPEEGADEDPSPEAPSPAVEEKRLIDAQYKLRGTKDRDPNTGKPIGITPASRAAIAHAYFVNNRITVA